MARGLAQAGAAVAIAARNRDKSEAAVAELRALGTQADFIAIDVREEASCQKAVRAAVERFGRLDILINNSGTTVRRPPQDIKAEDWQLVIDTNLSGAFYCAKAAFPEMLRSGGGKIINIGSMLSIFGAPYASPYGASKGGIVQL